MLNMNLKKPRITLNYVTIIQNIPMVSNLVLENTHKI